MGAHPANREASDHRGRLAQLGNELFSAAEHGGFDREDIHLTRTRLSLTPKGWRTLTRRLNKVLVGLDELRADEAAGLEDDPHAETIEATVVIAAFESPPPSAFDTEDEGSPWPDEIDDVAPPGRV